MDWFTYTASQWDSTSEVDWFVLPVYVYATATYVIVASGSLTLTGHAPVINKLPVCATATYVIVASGSLTLTPHHITITTTTYDFAIYDIVDTTKQSDKPELPREQPVTPVNDPIPSGSRYVKYTTCNSSLA